MPQRASTAREVARVKSARKPCRIGDVADLRTRSLLRGLLSKDVDGRTWSTLNHLRETTSSADIEIVSRLLLTNNLFKHVRTVDDFPPLPAIAFSVHRFVDQPLEHELIYQCIRIEQNGDRLAKALADWAVVNEKILANRSDEILSSLEHFIDSYGYSLVVMSKLAFINAQYPADTRIREFCAERLALYGADQRNAIPLASIDMMGSTYEFLTLRKNLLEFANSRTKSRIGRDIINWQFRPIRFDKDDLASQLQSHGLISLLDVLAFIFIHRHNVGIMDDLRVSHVIDQYVPSLLRERWLKLSAPKIPSGQITPGFDVESEFIDSIFYRRSLAWIENKRVSEFRNGFDGLFLENNMPRISHHEGIKFVKKYFSGTKSLADLAEAPTNVEINLNHYRNKEAGMFTRTIGFIYLMRGGLTCAGLTSGQLLALLNWTREIARLVSPDELKTFFRDSPPDGVGAYLASALISDCSKLNTDQHKLRRVLQSLVSAEFNGDLVAFAEYLATHSKYVGMHFFELCTEEFLAQLFFLFPTTDSIFETRARLLEWFSDKYKEPAFRDRARTLRLDAKLRTVRGEIDDTRIYVDPLRYGQWLEDNILDQLSSLFRGGEINQTDINEFKEFGDFAENRRPHVRLALALNLSFEEFCENKRYGVDSYLGRRIRHGTLKGVMLAHVRSIFEKQKYRAILSNSDVRQIIENWFAIYDAKLTSWGQETFQIASKLKPHGQIVPNITEAGKIEITRTVLTDLVRVFGETNSLADVNQVIFESCWRLLERDLARIRAIIENSRVTWGSLNPRQVAKVANEDQRSLVRELCREVNTLTAEKFRALSRWFTKPLNLAPSASLSLLLDAVLSEVKEQFVDYRPEVTRTNVSDFELVGMIYHHVYDFLFVVIHNAAKYGARNGLLLLKVSTSEPVDGFREFEIVVSNQIRSDASYDAVRKDIDAAMNLSRDDAMVVESKSGLPKLLLLASDVKEIVSIWPTYEADIVSIHCKLRLAAV